eukprot:TRINITY_DN7261_c0_g1_i4.p1 TRINITY_DN7261_c0_g1~~TRINITY_DN7261_c0_g1_i4.p1  ORF type:complete len:572 (-),score=112.35 TRINITY_DN7261_c0_g1_i4:327-2042(-)
MPWGFSNLWNRITRKKVVYLPFFDLEPDEDEELERSLTWKDLTMFGVGAIIGAGIFVLTGVAAREKSGPAVSIAYLIDGLACILSALCYSELASRIPNAGSAYSYGYVALGELVGFLMGWALVLEYTFGVATVARGWAGYIRAFFYGAGIDLPEWLTSYPLNDVIDLNFFAGLAVVLITGALVSGIQGSSIINHIITGTSLVVIVFVVIYGAFFVDVRNWKNFAPYGFNGIFSGASVVFFAFIGFDSVANLGEETKNPNKDLPIAIISSVVISSLLYFLVGLIVTGMVPYNELDLVAPLAAAFGSHDVAWAEIIISIGSFAALTTTMLVTMLSQSRIIYALARDGLLPKHLSQIWKSRPFWAQIFSGVLCFLLAFFLNFNQLAELTSAGALFAFSMVNFSLLVLRCEDAKQPLQPLVLSVSGLVGLVIGIALSVRLSPPSNGGGSVAGVVVVPIILGVGMIIPVGHMGWYFYKSVIPNEPTQVGNSGSSNFRSPFVPFIPMFGLMVNVYLLCSLEPHTFVGFFVWAGVGILIYFFYGVHHSLEEEILQEEIPLMDSRSYERLKADLALGGR